jgi:DNA polymerase II large subunit
LICTWGADRLNGNMSDGYTAYIETMEHQLKQLYAISDSARANGMDPTLKTECVIAKDIADLVEGLVGPKGVAVSIRELGAKLQREEIAFKIAEEIVYDIH